VLWLQTEALNYERRPPNEESSTECSKSTSPARLVAGGDEGCRWLMRDTCASLPGLKPPGAGTVAGQPVDSVYWLVPGIRVAPASGTPSSSSCRRIPPSRWSQPCSRFLVPPGLPPRGEFPHRLSNLLTLGAGKWSGGSDEMLGGRSGPRTSPSVVLSVGWPKA
jgi:hypothetical protein